MTDKIILDGVDVSGCEFREESPVFRLNNGCSCRGDCENYDLHTHINCVDNPNCYYKQLQRAKAEIEEFKNKPDYWKDKYADVHIRLTNRISELQAENERLKEYLTEINKIAKDTNYNDRIVFLDNMEVIRKISEVENER